MFLKHNGECRRASSSNLPSVPSLLPIQHDRTSMHTPRPLLPLLLLFSLACTSVRAQDTLAQTGPAREVGVRVTGLENFAILYKRARTQDRYLRYNFLFGNISVVAGDATDNVGALSLGGSVTWERRRRLGDRLDLVTGPTPSASAGVVTGNEVAVYNFGVRFGYLVGVQYYVSERFYVGLDVVPGIGANYTGIGGEQGNLFSFNLGLMNSGAGLSGVVRF